MILKLINIILEKISYYRELLVRNNYIFVKFDILEWLDVNYKRSIWELNND